MPYVEHMGLIPRITNYLNHSIFSSKLPFNRQTAEASNRTFCWMAERIEGATCHGSSGNSRILFKGLWNPSLSDKIPMFFQCVFISDPTLQGFFSGGYHFHGFCYQVLQTWRFSGVTCPPTKWCLFAPRFSLFFKCYFLALRTNNTKFESRGITIVH